MSETDPASLPARAYLVCCDLDRGRLFDRMRTVFVVRAAALAALALDGTARDDSGTVLIDRPAVGRDPVLDQVAADLAEHRLHWRAALRRRHRWTCRLVEEQLAAAGAIAVTRRALGRARISVADRASAAALQRSIAAVLTDTRRAADVPPDEAALAVIAVSASVGPVATRLPGRAARSRADDLADGLDAIAPPLGRTLRQLGSVIRGAMAAASGG
ncbi:MAG TPA: hypothetical protein VGM10_35250 [Actinocrinis sp.]